MTDPDNPNEPVKVKLAPVTWQEGLWDLAKKQGAAAIILGIAVYFMATWIAAQVQWVKEQVPNHLQSIKDGYREVARDHLEARREADLRHNEALKSVIESCKDSMDRTERLLGNRVEATAKRVGMIERKVDEKLDQ